jgi:NADPH-dependent 2,4-dienoyl-CoA reductase/sulfur reductase-like enzyme
MRVSTPGVMRVAEPFTLQFEDTDVTAWPGESLAAALLSNGIVGLRTTAGGEMRGLYCGMGICGECRVKVDGVVQRACMTRAAPRQHVSRAPARAEPGCLAPPRSRISLSPDLLVVGAGPAGLSAARVAAQGGLSVLVADERHQAGGQYFKQPGSGFSVRESALDAQTSEGRKLAAAAHAAGAELLPGATLWAGGMTADGRPELHFTTDAATISVQPRRLVLAMGAYERPWPVPGWTLPGTMTSGAAQTLLRAYQTAPGQRVLIAGNGPLNLQVARELQRAGVEVVALVEQAPSPHLRRAASALRMALTSPSLVWNGLTQLTALSRRTPIFYEHVLIGVEGNERAEQAIIGRVGSNGGIEPGSVRRFAVDAICLGYGFLPQAEAARALGCAFEALTGGGIRAVRSDDGRSSVDGIFIAGDGGGLGGARVAMAQGTAAGAAAVNDLTGQLPLQVAREQRTALRALARHRRFQAALWQLYAPSAAYRPPDDDRTLLCRCEGVSTAAVGAILESSAQDLGAVKRVSRTGMGACQGRYCAALLAARVDPAGAHASPGFAPRPPFKPVTIEAIASLTRKPVETVNTCPHKEH